MATSGLLISDICRPMESPWDPMSLPLSRGDCLPLLSIFWDLSEH